jgi:hypothetical protein
LGVREGLIVLALSVFAASPVPLVAAILSRIGWTVSEIVGLIVIEALRRFASSTTGKDFSHAP